MTIFEEVVTWAKTRPWWQQQVIVRIAAGDQITDDECREIAESLLGEPPEEPSDGWLGDLRQPLESAAAQVQLVELSDIQNINRLAAGQELTFGQVGLTVVYGHNGSGKSGYARVIKSMVRTRANATILPDVFVAAPGVMTATLAYTVDGSAERAQLAELSPVALGRVAFYDETCGDAYLTTEYEVTYRPSTLTLLDDLYLVSTRVRDHLANMLDANAGEAQILPSVAPGTVAAGFLERLTELMPDSLIDSVCQTLEGDEQELVRLRGEQDRLRSTDPSRERERLVNLAYALTTVSRHVESLETSLGVDAERALAEARGRADEAREAANVASMKSFESEALAGVGTSTWRALWEAARRFSLTEAYPAHQHPYTGADARCVLCHQSLSEDAADRLRRFNAFMTADMESRADTSELELSRLERELAATDVRSVPAAVALETIGRDHPQVRVDADGVIAYFELRKAALTAEAANGPDIRDLGPTRRELTERANAAHEAAASIDTSDFMARLDELKTAEHQVASRIALAASKDGIFAERDRLQARRRIEVARSQAATKGITDKVAELTRKYVTVSAQDRFSRESDRLMIERITLKDTKGRRGALLHKPGFIDAATSAALPQVLSEGEQTALGLAGFLTEAHFDTSRSALVLDDPVTSLDHVRREKVAQRLVEYSKDRQVIVFTHDVTFSADLRRICTEERVDFTERSIERGPMRTPGLCRDRHPWSVNDGAARIQRLREGLATIKKSVNTWDTDTYEREVKAWAGDLSETWERIVSQEIAGQLLTPGTLEVRPMMMKVVARISDDDNREFQDSYSRCSRWAPRHDKNPSLNYTAPDVADLQREVDLIDAWFRRVKKYKS